MSMKGAVGPAGWLSEHAGRLLVNLTQLESSGKKESQLKMYKPNTITPSLLSCFWSPSLLQHYKAIGQQVKAPAAIADGLSLIPGSQGVWGRELTPTNCPLTCICYTSNPLESHRKRKSRSTELCFKGAATTHTYQCGQHSLWPAW